MTTRSQDDLIKALQRSAQVIQSLETRLKSYEQPIAIIGMGCRFAGGADTPEKFWQLLRDGVDAVTAAPRERWDIDADDAPNPATPQKMIPWWAGFLAEVAWFDPLFFGISPREALGMDPQHQLLLETSWEALEYAGLPPATLFNSQTAVFVGMVGSDYATLLAGRPKAAQPDAGPEQGIFGATGSAPSIAAGRLAYTFGLTGPAMVIDTACSSSLVAIHEACQSLRLHECTLALAGGVNLILDPQVMVELSNAQMLAPDGRCKTFDARADGYSRGEGCGIVVLKRLNDAIADQDNILAVIRGSAINQDGRSSGLTAPSGPAQQAVIRQALQRSKIEPHQVAYIEAHGTGTALGDPIEVGALSAVFGQRSTPLWVGSVKTNIGHTEAAAGVAGLIKLVLALQQGEIPPSLHFQTPNPYIDWKRTPCQIPTARQAWPPGERIAGLSSFGMSGTNAHLVVAAWQPAEKPGAAPAECPAQLLTLSAKSEAALRALAERYVTFLQERTTVTLADLCYTASTGRNHFAHRLSVVATTAAEMQAKLAVFQSGKLPGGSSQGYLPLNQAPPAIAFLFTGQGAQYVQMGRELYDTAPTFRRHLEECDALLQPLLGVSILQILYPADEQAACTENSPLTNTLYAQPALFALEYALARVCQSWGITPTYVVGHSVGEYVAACVAGVFSLADGLKLIAARSRLMSNLPTAGAMVAVMAGEAQVQAALHPYKAQVAIAAINGPDNVVISGERHAVQTIAQTLTQQGVKTTPLPVSHAFHSPLMEPILSEFAAVAQTITYHPPRLPVVSNLTGNLTTASSAARLTEWQYWVRHIRQPVRFADSIATLRQAGVTVFLELGPKPTLLGMTQVILDATPAAPAASPPTLLLPTLRPNAGAQHDWQTLLGSIGALYTQGVQVNWASLANESTPSAGSTQVRRKVILPTYPFQRQRYWQTIDWRRPEQPAQQRLSAEQAALSQLPAALDQPAPTFHQQVARLAIPEQQAKLFAYIRTEVSAIIGLPADSQLDAHERLLDLGIDSLMAYTLRSRLQSYLACSLPSTLLFDYPTLAELATYLAEVVFATEGAPALQATTRAVQHSHTPSTLVPLQPHGSRRPFFLVSGILGSAFDFQRLAQQVSSEQPIYGLRSLGIDEDSAPFSRIAEIAAYHNRCLQSVQPVGPYQLGGYSFGGKVAYEMAQQLHHQGHEIALLAILDTPFTLLGESQQAASWEEAQFVLTLAELYLTFAEQPIAEQPIAEQPIAEPSSTDLAVTSLVVGGLDFVRSLPRAEQIAFLQNCAQRVGIHLDQREMERMLQVYKANLLAYSTYRPQSTWPLPITLIRAREHMPFDLLPTEAMTQQDPTWGWQPFSTPPLDLHFVPGNHLSMLEAPHVAQLAACLSRKLEHA